MSKKIVVVNAGPRRGWNTDTLLTEAAKGAEVPADPPRGGFAETETSIKQVNQMRNVTKLSDNTVGGVRSTSFATCGITCSTQINIQTEGDTIRRVEIVKGCDGNTKGLARLCEGRKIQDVIGLLEGIDCKGRGTSCPDQLARALKEL